MARADLLREFEEAFVALAATNQRAADAALVDGYGFSPSVMLAASSLIAALRWFQHLQSLGVDLNELTPQLILEVMKNGDAAVTQAVQPASGPIA